MKLNRKKFINIAGVTAAGIVFPSLAGKLFASNLFDNKKKIKSFGLQLYGVRNLLDTNPGSVLKQVAAMGYRQVEAFEHAKLGLYLGMGNTGFKTFLNDTGLKLPSVHVNVYKDFEKKVEEAAAIGVKFFIYNWEGPGKTLDDYKRMADEFNTKGEFCKQHGLCFTFHNHDFTFTKMDGVLPQEWLLEHTDKNLVDFQVDLYWVIAAGQDPVAHINKYPDRYKLCHFKDRSAGATEREGKAICELGTGTINFADILNKTRHSSIKYYIVDQDTCNDRIDPLQCLRVDAEYMKKLQWE